MGKAKYFWCLTIPVLAAVMLALAPTWLAAKTRGAL